MKAVVNYAFLCGIILVLAFYSCNKDDSNREDIKTIEVVRSYVPFKTEQYLRIPYMLKTWEFLKQGLTLEKIIVFDNKTQAELMVIDKANLPIIIMAPLPQSTEFSITNIDSYYLSLQVPIPLNQKAPVSIGHRFELRDTINNRNVVVTGGFFQPRSSESPIVISSPHRGDYYLIGNVSTNGYHFYYAGFAFGDILTSEKFAFDTSQTDSTFSNSLTGDPSKNESYFIYGDTIYAVADGTVIHLTDGRIENQGDAHNVPLSVFDDYAGNHLVIDIGGGVFAAFAHCLPGSFLVSEGDHVKEGQPIARVGNSGNSTEPHLHFQLQDSPDMALSHGLPFVFKKYTKIGQLGFEAITPFEVSNACTENYDFVNFN